MNTNIFSLKTVSRAAGALALCSASLSAQTTGSGWTQWGQQINFNMSVQGPNESNNDCKWNDAVCGYDTSNQKMSSDMSLTISKGSGSTDGFDYYLVQGLFSHGVNQYKEFAPAVKGWYGQSMMLYTQGHDTNGNSAVLLDAQPYSTSFSTSSTFDVNGGSGSSLGYSFSVNAPDVTMNTNSDNSSVTYNVSLPALGYSNNDMAFPIPSSPYPSSKSGATVNIGMVYKVPQGNGLLLNVNNNVEWDFWQLWDTRGVTNLPGTGTFVVDFTGQHIQDQSGQCMTANANGTVTMSTCNYSGSGPTAQTWDYTQYSQIKNEATNTCLDYQGPAAEGTTLILNPCAQNQGSDTAKWAICTTMKSQGRLRIRSISGFTGSIQYNGIFIPGNPSRPITLTATGDYGDVWVRNHP